ncbi:MAG: HD domain-containing protein [Actinomycetota bacterium]|nr:HD domain-containing protein [Actinomycetota bacterium]
MSMEMPWPAASPLSATEVVNALFALYRERGGTHYDASVTQAEHALQSAALAEAESAGDALVVAALLHDIGHLLVDEHDGRGEFLAGDEQHERIGARVLAPWFPAEVTGPIALHVPAKRYLVATDPDYAATLSDASTRSLAVQGGPMTDRQATTFSQQRFADVACRLRRWDDRAKLADAGTPTFEHYGPAVARMVRLREGTE